MAERPILFSLSMVQAIWAGKKTVTRRIGQRLNRVAAGDLLWVRETWRYHDWTDAGIPFIEYRDGAVLYRGDIPEEWSGRVVDIWADLSGDENYRIHNRACDQKWRPSIFMPRWASRLDLRVVGIREERLQDITAADAIAEGALVVYPDMVHDPVGAFRLLWESVNGQGSWDSNPLVTVIEFSGVESPS